MRAAPQFEERVLRGLLRQHLVAEHAQHQSVHAGGGELQRWISVTAVLGAAFLACQLLGWKELTARGRNNFV